MKDDKIWDIHDIGKQGKIALDRIGDRNARAQDFYFLSATRESLARGRNFSSRAPDEGKGRSSEVAEQGDGDEMHLAEGMVDEMIRRL